MKKQNWLINLIIIGSLWFSLAFACKNNNDRSGGRTTSYDTTPARQTERNTGGALTEQQIKDFFTDLWMQKCESGNECKVTFDSPVTIGAPVSHTSAEGDEVSAYPVKVDYTSFSKVGTVNEYGLHHKGGTYYFYRNSGGEWEMSSSGVSNTF